MNRLHCEKSRTGISKVEVLVLLGFLVILAGVLLLYFRESWEYSRRAVCQQHLKILGESCQSYYQKNSRLPPNLISKRYATWPVVIAGHLPRNTAEALRTQWKIPFTYYQQPPAARQDRVSLFFCPARRTVSPLSLNDIPSNGFPANKNYPGALGDYGGCAGDGSVPNPLTNPKANGAIVPAVVIKQEDKRILQWEGQVKMVDLKRGKSYTLLLGEKHVPLGEFGKVEFGDGSLYNGDYPASSSRLAGPGFGIAKSPDSPFNRNFGSAHRNVCYFLLADGGVRGYANSMDEEVLGNLARRKKSD